MMKYIKSVVAALVLGIMALGVMPAMANTAQDTGTLTNATTESDTVLFKRGKGDVSVSGTWGTASFVIQRLQKDGSWVTLASGTLASAQVVTVALATRSIMRVAVTAANGSTSIAYEITEGEF